MKSRTLNLLLTMVLALAATPSQAEQTEAEHAVVTVGELMRLENEQALEAMRARKRQQATQMPHASIVSPVVPAAGDTQPRLVGIYGVGKRLFAEVRAGSQAWLFLRGQPAPVGYGEAAAPWRLKAISGACVHLEGRSEETVLCLARGGRS